MMADEISSASWLDPAPTDWKEALGSARIAVWDS